MAPQNPPLLQASLQHTGDSDDSFPVPIYEGSWTCISTVGCVIYFLPRSPMLRLQLDTLTRVGLAPSAELKGKWCRLYCPPLCKLHPLLLEVRVCPTQQLSSSSVSPSKYVYSMAHSPLWCLRQTKPLRWSKNSPGQMHDSWLPLSKALHTPSPAFSPPTS